MYYLLIIVFVLILILAMNWLSINTENYITLSELPDPIQNLLKHLKKVKIVTSLSDRIKGFSGQKNILKNEGMLFVYPRGAKQGIWMKDMLEPINIYWINNKGQIIHQLHNVSPDTYPKTFAPPVATKYVLETGTK